MEGVKFTNKLRYNKKIIKILILFGFFSDSFRYIRMYVHTMYTFSECCKYEY